MEQFIKATLLTTVLLVSHVTHLAAMHMWICHCWYYSLHKDTEVWAKVIYLLSNT